MKNLKYILIFLLLIIISATGYIGWDYYNTKKIEQEKIAQEKLKQEEQKEELTEDQLRYRNKVEPKDWNVFESEEYGYRIKYPEDWRTNEVGNTFWHNEIVQYGPLVHIAGARNRDKNKIITLEEFLEYNLNNRSNLTSFYGTAEPIDLIEGLKEVIILDDNGNVQVYIIQESGRIFTLVSNPPDWNYETIVTGDNEAFAEAFEKMYKSLEFIE